jgi:hypothetical protein
MPPITAPAERPTVDLDSSWPGWARRERFRLDGVRYDIYVAARNQGYCGIWVCVDCGEHGSSPIIDRTPEEAHARSKLSLCVHHKLNHRRAIDVVS